MKKPKKITDILEPVTELEELFCQTYVNRSIYAARKAVKDKTGWEYTRVGSWVTRRLRDRIIQRRIMVLRTLRALGEAQIEEVLSQHEKRKILAQVARGQLQEKSIATTKWGESKKIRTLNPIDAIAEDNKMVGDYAPARVDHTSGGKPIQPISISVVSENAALLVNQLINSPGGTDALTDDKDIRAELASLPPGETPVAE